MSLGAAGGTLGGAGARGRVGVEVAEENGVHGRQLFVLLGQIDGSGAGLDTALLIRVLLQVGLRLYMANIFKSMKGASRQPEEDLILAGHANMFPSEPKSTKKGWEFWQELDYCTLLCTYVHNGNASAWSNAMAGIGSDIC